MQLSANQLLLYAVTDDAWLDGRALADCVEDCLRGGATFVQFRRKGACLEPLIREAGLLKSLCDDASVPFVINDYIEAAVAVGCGLHIGQEDGEVRRAREHLGSDSILGVSAQTLEQALRAEDEGADYLGVGALFKTATKPEAAEVSLETLHDICSAVSVPVVGIGGLDERTIPMIAGSGAAGAAVVSAIFAADDIEVASSRLHSICQDCFVGKVKGEW